MPDIEAWVHEEYEDMLTKWDRARTVIKGEDAVKAARYVYLPMLDGQSATEYDAYLKRTSFYNATGRTKEGLQGMVCRKAPTVVIPDESKKLVEDFDLNGMSLDAYSEHVIDEVITVGRAGTFVDWSQSERRAYAAFYKAEDILNWRTTRIGEKTVLSMILLHEKTERPVEGPGLERTTSECVERLKLVELVGGGEAGALQCQVQTFVKAEVEEKKPGTRPKKKVDWIPEGPPAFLTKNDAPIGFIPFQFHGVKAGPCLQKPPLDDIICVNLGHYRLDADYKHALHFCCTPTAWVAGFPSQQNGKPVILKIGSGVAWLTENENAKAGFLEFTGQGLAPLEVAMDKAIHYMATLGARLLEVPKKDAEATETVQIRSSGEASVLADIANGASESLSWAMRIAVWWGKPAADLESVTPEAVSVKLNTDFTAIAMTPEQMTALATLWIQGGISRKTLNENLRRGEVLSEDRTDEEELELINDEIATLPARQPPPEAKPAKGKK